MDDIRQIEESLLNLDEERLDLLRQIEDWLDLPMAILGFIWLALLTYELVWGITPLLETLLYVIWVIFIAHFALEFVVAPKKSRFIRSNWLTVIALIVPAIRVFRVFAILRYTRFARGLVLTRLLSSTNRSMRALRATFSRRGFGYVLALSVTITVAGSAGIYWFERGAAGIESFGDALWFTSMIMTTLGSQYWPVTSEGRVLAFLLGLYAFTAFGYVTATLASFFIGRDAMSDQTDLYSTKSVKMLQKEVELLNAQVKALTDIIERMQRQ